MGNEVGLYASYLAPGLHFIVWPLTKLVEKSSFFSINADELGIVEATDGRASRGEAAKVRMNAEAEVTRVKQIGDVEASIVLAKGQAVAMADREQVAALTAKVQ
jgi:hypothetical protein